MDFVEAMRLMKEGKSVRRKIWRGDYNLFIDRDIGQFGSYYNNDLLFGQLLPISVDDINAEDWEEYKPGDGE